MIMIVMSFSILLIVISMLPFVQNQHWIFRVAEFIKLQLLPLQLITFVRVKKFLMYAYIAYKNILGICVVFIFAFAASKPL